MPNILTFLEFLNKKLLIIVNYFVVPFERKNGDENLLIYQEVLRQISIEFLLGGIFMEYLIALIVILILLMRLIGQKPKD